MASGESIMLGSQSRSTKSAASASRKATRPTAVDEAKRRFKIKALLRLERLAVGTFRTEYRRGDGQPWVQRRDRRIRPHEQFGPPPYADY